MEDNLQAEFDLSPLVSSRVQSLYEDVHHHLNLYGKSETNCEEYGCNEDGICRCGVIVDLGASGPVMAPRLLDIMFQNENLSLKIKHDSAATTERRVDAYVYSRLLAQHEVNFEDLNWSASSNYYGEEIDYVKLPDSVSQEIEDQVSQYHNACEGFPDQTRLKEKVKWARMQADAGEEIEDVDYTIEKVDLKQIQLPSQPPASNSQAAVDYKGSISDSRAALAAPILLVSKQEDHYELIDGLTQYHALSELSQEKIWWNPSNYQKERQSFYRKPLVLVASGPE